MRSWSSVVAFERRAVVNYHLLFVDADDFLRLCLLLRWQHIVRSETLDHVSFRIVLHFSDDHVAIDSPSACLNDLSLVVAERCNRPQRSFAPRLRCMSMTMLSDHFRSISDARWHGPASTQMQSWTDVNALSEWLGGFIASACWYRLRRDCPHLPRRLAGRAPTRSAR